MTVTRHPVTVERGVPCPMRDGTVLLADIYRPKGEGPFPVLLVRTPYDRFHSQANLYAHPSWYAQQGYVVVSQDVRGRWRSEGDWYPFFNEANDGFDTIAWAAQLPGTTGQVGMYGASYVGATQMLAAITSPPALRVICPAITSSDYYEGWTYEGGALHLAFVIYWALQLAMDTARRRSDEDTLRRLAEASTTYTIGQHQMYLPLEELPLFRESRVLGYFFDWLRHPTYDEYWQQVAIAPRHDRILAAGLHIGGWYDIFLDGTLTNFTGIQANGGSPFARQHQRLIIGPWYHSPWTPFCGEADFGPRASSRIVDETQIRFYNWLLKGEDDGISREPPVKLFVMGENVWRDEQEWPLRRAVSTPFYFHSGGLANAFTGDGTLSTERPGEEPPDVYVYDPRTPAVSRGGHSCCREHLDPQGRYDQRLVERNKDVLCYTSDPLDAPLEVTGPVSVTLWAATSAVDTDWVVRLVDVYPDGRAMNVTEGILRARFRDSLQSPSLLERDRVYEYRINLRATSNVFLPGHRIRVDVASSSFPHWDRNPNTGAPIATVPLSQVETATQTVFHDAARPSHILLPVVPRPRGL